MGMRGCPHPCCGGKMTRLPFGWTHDVPTDVAAMGERRGRLYERAYGLLGRRGAAVRAMACIIAGLAGHRCSSPVRACHGHARGMGGVNGDARSLFPGCDRAHDLAGGHRTSQREGFERVHMVDVTAICEEIALELDGVFGPEPCHDCRLTSGHTLVCKTADGIRAERESRHAR